jgi:hypothetical protein
MKLYAQPMSYMPTWDYTGMALSSLCMVHCVVLQMFVLVFPLVELGLLAGEGAHQLLVALMLPIAALAVLPGYRQHKKKRVLAGMGLGLCLLLAAGFGEWEARGEAWEVALTLLGGGFLATSHWLNRYFCKLCLVCRSEPCCVDS